MSAADLTPADFAAFFQAVHDTRPFPWQQRLLCRVAKNGTWPEVLDLPTGSGKTAALDIAVFHLALEAARGPERTAPIRIAFVVDRRLIVDDAFERARKLQLALAAPKSEIVARVAAALRRFVHAGGPPLLARPLRGGMPREDDWARTPCQPTILCSTVDQVGSRLLFRGYGITDRMKPVHAGLLGSDCLILLDEAHLAEPFRQTLKAVGCLRGNDTAPWQVALLTATPSGQGKVQFGLCRDDREHPLLSKRLTASKPAKLIEIPSRQGAPVETRRIEEIAERTNEILLDLSRTIQHPAVGVVVNRVARARSVFERLKDELPNAETILVIGPAREVDRDSVAGKLRQIRTGVPRTLEKPLVIVATQTIEAGVDIDLDGLVTEAAALDALRQRFGRLNRAGREISPVAAILAAREDVGTKADDPVYGDRIAKTWNALCTAAGSSDGSIDFGIEAFPKQLTYQATNLVSPKPDAPVLMPAYADLWSQTWPVPKADPEIALFLHGANRSPASVQVVWRADIRESDLSNADEDAREAMLEAIRLMPPRPAEAIEIPLWAARAWLRNQTASLADLSDAPERAPEGPEAGRNRRVFRYAGGDNERSRAIDPNDIVPGDLIVVPAAYGGCDEWGWILASKPQAVDDVAHAASWPYRYRRYAVRVTAELMHQGFQKDTEAETGSGAPIADIDEIERKLSSVLGHYEDAKDAKPVVDAILALDLPKCLRESLQPLHDGSYRRRLGTPFFYRGAFNEPRGVVFVAPFGLKHAGIEVTGWEGDVGDAAPPATESDEIGLFGGYPLLLKVHSDDVRRWACDFSGRAGLPPEVAADVALAGYLHDCGKSDRRFQTYLAGGDLLGWQEGEALAKSGRDRLPKDAWERSGLPDRRWRHEARSVRLALNQAEFAAAGDQALVLWLVGVHHGFGRPFFPHADPDEPADRPGPQSLAFDFDGRDWPGMFEKLKRDYGIWGLARLEAFVRLADHRASEEAERRYANEGTR